MQRVEKEGTRAVRAARPGPKDLLRSTVRRDVYTRVELTGRNRKEIPLRAVMKPELRDARMCHALSTERYQKGERHHDADLSM